MSTTRPSTFDRSTLLPSINSWLTLSIEKELPQIVSREEFINEHRQKYDGETDASKEALNLIFDALAMASTKQLERASKNLLQAEQMIRKEDQANFQLMTGLTEKPSELIRQYLSTKEDEVIYLDIHTIYLRGIIYYERNFMTNALKDFKRVLGLPDYYLNESIMKLVAGALFYIGLLHDRKNQYENAIRHFNEAMLFDFDGTVLPTAMRTQIAEKYFACERKILKNPPLIPEKKHLRDREVESYLAIASDHIMKKKYEFAIRDYGAAISIDPTSGSLYMLRAKAHLLTILNLTPNTNQGNNEFLTHTLMATQDYTIAIWLQITGIDSNALEHIRDRYRKRRDVFALARLMRESIHDHVRATQLCPQGSPLLSAIHTEFGETLCDLGDKALDTAAFAKSSDNRSKLYDVALNYFEIANAFTPRAEITQRIVAASIQKNHVFVAPENSAEQEEKKAPTPPPIKVETKKPKKKRASAPIDNPSPESQSVTEVTPAPAQINPQKEEKKRLKNLAKKKKRELRDTTIPICSAKPTESTPIKEESKKSEALIFGEFVVRHPNKKILSTVREAQLTFTSNPFLIFEAIAIATQQQCRLSDSIKKNILIAIESLQKENSDALRQALEKLLSKTTLAVVIEALFPALQPFQDDLAMIMAFKENSASTDPIIVNKALGKMLKKPHAEQNFLALVNLGSFYDIFPLLKSHHEAILKIMEIEDKLMQSDFTQLYDQFLVMMPTKESEPPHQHPHPLLKSHYTELNRYYATLSNHPNRFLKAKSVPEKKEKTQVETLQRVNTR